MNKTVSVCGKTYSVLSLLGHGKGGYSYLAEREGRQVVLKQIHHEPCDYYQFGNKIEAEERDYYRLKKAGIRIPDDIHVTALANRSSGGGLAFPVPFTRMEVDSIADGRTVASAVIEYLKTGAFPSGVTVGPKYVRGKTF